jgi:hypothetical protein
VASWRRGAGFTELEAPESTTDLRRIAVTLAQLADAENELRDAVVAARANGRSWGRISLVLSVSKQAARQRFGAAADPKHRDLNRSAT